MKIDFDKAARLARLGGAGTLSRRQNADLPFVNDSPAEGGAGLLLDTTVTIDAMQRRLPEFVWGLIERRVVHHSTIPVVELMHVVGRLDPRHPRSADAVASIRRSVQAIPDHRLHAPDADVLSRAAVLAGVLCRLQGYAKDDRLRALNDCALYLQAIKLGLTVLTRNLRDYDFLLQLLPEGRVLLYMRGGD